MTATEQLQAVLVYLNRTPASALVNREIIEDIRRTLDTGVSQIVGEGARAMTPSPTQ